MAQISHALQVTVAGALGHLLRNRAHPSLGPFGAVLSDVPLRPQVTGRASDSGHLLLTLEHCGVRGTHPLHRHLHITLTPPTPKG